MSSQAAEQRLPDVYIIPDTERGVKHAANEPSYDSQGDPIIYGRRSLKGIWVQCEAGCEKDGECAWHLYEETGLQESKCWSWDSEHHETWVVVELRPMVR